MFHQTLDRAEAGDQVGALIKGVKRDELKRGMIIAKPGTLKLANKAMAQVRCPQVLTLLKRSYKRHAYFTKTCSRHV